MLPKLKWIITIVVLLVSVIVFAHSVTPQRAMAPPATMTTQVLQLGVEPDPISSPDQLPPDPEFTPADPYEIPRIKQLALAFMQAHADEGGWYVCGERMSPNTWADMSLNLAQKLYAEELIYGVNASKAMATIWHESRGDPCAIGVYARRFAQKKGWIKKQKRISYSYLESLSMAEHWIQHAGKVDLGLCQVLFPLYKRADEHLEDLLTFDGGLRYCLSHAKWLSDHSHESPWNLWRGLTPQFIMQRTEILGRWTRKYIDSQVD